MKGSKFVCDNLMHAFEDHIGLRVGGTYDKLWWFATAEQAQCNSLAIVGWLVG